MFGFDSDSVKSVKKAAANPVNNFDMDDASVEHHEGNDVCGDYIRVYLKIDDNGIVENYSYNGCSSTFVLGGASIIVDDIKGKNISQLLELDYTIYKGKGLEFSNTRQIRQLSLSILSVRNAIHNYLNDGIIDELEDLY
ncbi:MAG: iron-sulfur cluster assembly scaffold protein [Candidatus Absconditabacteria bacterium]